MDWQIDRWTDKLTDGLTNRQMKDWQTVIQKMYGQMDRWKDRITEEHMNRHMGEQINTNWGENFENVFYFLFRKKMNIEKS